MRTVVLIAASLASGFIATDAWARDISSASTISAEAAQQLCSVFKGTAGTRGHQWWCDFKCGAHSCHISCDYGDCTLTVQTRTGTIFRGPTSLLGPGTSSYGGRGGQTGTGNGTTNDNGNGSGNGTGNSGSISSSRNIGLSTTKSIGFSTGRSGGATIQ